MCSAKGQVVKGKQTDKSKQRPNNGTNKLQPSDKAKGGNIQSNFSMGLIEKPPCKQKHTLRTQQAALCISLNKINMGRWDSRRAIKILLGQLLHHHHRLTDLDATEWLPTV